MSAIARRGGREKWLARLGLPPARPRPRRVPARRGPIPEQNRPRWTDETLERELRTFAAGRKFFPTTKEFLDAGKEDLQDAVKRYGGTIVWAQRLGMPLRNGQDRRPYGTDDAVADAKRALTEFGRLPDKDALRASGYPRLASFIARKCGGVRRFVAEYLAES